MIYTKTGAGAGPVGGYLAVGRSAVRRLSLYSFRKRALVPSLATNQLPELSTSPNSIQFSSAAGYITVSESSAMGSVYLLRRSGATWLQPSVNNSNMGSNARSAIALNGQYLAAVGGGTPNMRIWHVSGSTVTELSTIGTVGSSIAVAVSHDGSFVASGASGLQVKIRSGSGTTATYSNMSLASTPSGGTTQSIAFSSTGDHIAIGYNASPWTYIYKYNSGTSLYEHVSTPFSGTAPSATVVQCSFSADTNLLALQTSSKVLFYTRSGDTFTYESEINAGGNLGGSLHASGNYYILPSGTIYKRTSPTTWAELQSIGLSGLTISQFSPLI